MAQGDRSSGYFNDKQETMAREEMQVEKGTIKGGKD